MLRLATVFVLAAISAPPSHSARPGGVGHQLRLADAPLGEGVIFSGWWSPESSADLLVVVRHTGQRDRSVSELLVFWPKQRGWEPIFRRTYPLTGPVACYPAAGFGPFVTVWFSGSALEVVVLAFRDGKLGVVLDESADAPPELVFQAGADDGHSGDRVNPDILLTRWEWVPDKMGTSQKKPYRTSVFKWDGVAYSLAGELEFENRFEYLQRLAAPGSK